MNLTTNRSILRIINVVVILLGAIILLYKSYYNRYVLFYGDSDGYVIRAFENSLSHHWAMFYSLFIKWFSFGTLWSVIVVQNLIMSYLLYEVVCVFFSEHIKRCLYSLALVLLLSFTSSLGWFSNLIMSDIFSSICVLSMFLLIFSKKGNFTKVLLGILFLFSTIAHNSHPPIIGALLCLLTVAFASVYIVKYGFKFGRKVRTLIPLLSCWILFAFSIVALRPIVDTSFVERVPTSVKKKNEDQSVGRSEYSFVWLRLLSSGYYEECLNEYCPEKSYQRLCDKKFMKKIRNNKLPWREDFAAYPLFRSEMEDMAKTVLFDWKYLWPILKKGLNRGFILATNYRLAIFNKGITNNRRFQRVFKSISGDKHSYKSSLAYNGELKKTMSRANRINAFLLKYWAIYCILFLTLLWWLERSFSRGRFKTLVIFIIFVALAYYINCMLMGLFGNHLNFRYSSRLSWLLILSNYLLFFIIVDSLIINRIKMPNPNVQT